MTIKRRHFLQGSLAVTSYGLTAGVNAATDSSALLTKTIPSTGEQIPVIGLGTNKFGVGKSEAERAPIREVIKTFTDNGGTLIDTASSYRGSEAVIGELVAELGVGDQLFMATKCDKSGGDATRGQLQGSTELLGVGVIDLMEIHNLRDWQANLPVLREWKQDGKIRYLGITTSRNSQHSELADIMRNEELDFIQLNYSILDRNVEQELLPLAAEKSIAVLGNVPYSRGRLFSAVSGQDIPEWAAEFCNSWGQFFLKYNVSHPAMTACIPGTTKPHHALDNIGAAMGRLPEPAERKMQEEFIASL